MNWIKAISSIVGVANLFIMANIWSGHSWGGTVLLVILIWLGLTLPLVVFLITDRLRTFAVNALLISLVLIITEGAFFLRFVEHPAFSTWTRASKNIEVIEFLDEQPFVKFRPHSVVRSQLQQPDFTSGWVTDRYGYKNKVKNSADLKVDFIALGDSFTEGMGVGTADTWASKVNQSSPLSIYNAGVQGYSASQMKATYLRLMDEIAHDGIIIGALPRIYMREEIFNDPGAEKKLGVGGIRSIGETGHLEPSGSSAFLVGFIRAAKKELKFRYQKKPVKRHRSYPELISRYAKEIPITYISEYDLSTNKNWVSYSQNLIDLSNIARNQGKRVILIQFPERHEVYFNVEDLGLIDLSSSQYYTELKLLREALPSEVVVLDMYPKIKDYWLSNREFLYFARDGHMNELGHRLVAEFLVGKLTN